MALDENQLPFSPRVALLREQRPSHLLNRGPQARYGGFVEGRTLLILWGVESQTKIGHGHFQYSFAIHYSLFFIKFDTTGLFEMIVGVITTCHTQYT